MAEYETYGGSPSACWRAGGSGFADHRVLVAEAAPAFHRLQDLSERSPQGQQGILWQTVLQEREASLGVLKDAAAPGSGCGATAERPPDEQRADRAADGASAARSPCHRQADGRQGELR